MSSVGLKMNWSISKNSFWNRPSSEVKQRTSKWVWDWPISANSNDLSVGNWSVAQSTLKVLIDFCPVKSEFLTWSFVYKNFWHFTRNYYGISDLGLTLPHFEFLGLYLDMFDQNWSFVHKKWRFWSNIFKYRLNRCTDVHCHRIVISS